MSEPLLIVRHLSKRFPIEGGIFRQTIGEVRALENFSLELAPGETVCLVGGSGSGKSTAAKLIAGLLEPDVGELLWQGKPLDQFTRLERARCIQMVFQDPYATLNPKLSVGTQLVEVVRNANPAARAAQAEAKAAQLLTSVGLTADVLRHYPFQFSGGQRQRIAIARALAMEPKLLIADEPLSALDVTVQAQVLDLLQSLRQSLGLTLLFITHDLAIIRHFADRVVVLQDGKMVETGRPQEVLTAPSHPYTRALLSAVPQVPC